MVFADLRRAKTMSLGYYDDVFKPSHMHFYDQEFHLKQEAKLEDEEKLIKTPANNVYKSGVFAPFPDPPTSVDTLVPFTGA